MILYLNGSPKLEISNSNFFLNELKNKNDKIEYIYKNNYIDLVKKLDNVNTIVLAFPLYVDAPTNKVIEFMEYIEDNKIDIENKNIYIIINCGFLESKHNIIASDIIKQFCNKNKAIYKGEFLIGAGEIIGKINRNKLYKIASCDYLVKIKKFKSAILNNEAIHLKTTIKPMTKRLYVYLANINWNNHLKENNVKSK